MFEFDPLCSTNYVFPRDAYVRYTLLWHALHLTDDGFHIQFDFERVRVEVLYTCFIMNCEMLYQI